MLPLEVGRLPSRAPRNNPIDSLLCSSVDVTLPPYCARAVGTSAQSPLRTISPTPVGNLNPCCGRCLSVPSSLTTAPHMQGRTAVLRCWPPGASATTPPVSSRSRCLNPPQSQLLLYITEITLAWSMAFWILAEQGGCIRRRS